MNLNEALNRARRHYTYNLICLSRFDEELNDTYRRYKVLAENLLLTLKLQAQLKLIDVEIKEHD